MQNRPKVSVCIPSYNHARFLPAAIESVLAQTFKDFEIIIVDDGSTDESLEIARHYAADYPALIRVFTHPEQHNKGVSATVNLAYQKTRGEYWSGLPSDDVLHPDKLAHQVEILDAHPDVGWVYGPGVYIDEEGRRLLEMGLFGSDVRSEPDSLEGLIQRNVVPGMSVLMRRSVSEAVGLHDESLVYSDWEYWIRMLVHSPVTYIDRPLIFYRLHGYNTSFGSEKHLPARRALDVIRSLQRKAPEIGGGLLRPRTAALLHLQSAYLLFCLGEHAKAEQSLGAAFEAWPELYSDSHYVGRWLRKRIYEAWFDYPTNSVERQFGSWVGTHLPADLPRALAHRVAAAHFATVALENHQRNLKKARWAALRCFLKDASWLRDKSLRTIFLKSFGGHSLIKAVRRLETQFPRVRSR